MSEPPPGYRFRPLSESAELLDASAENVRLPQSTLDVNAIPPFTVVPRQYTGAVPLGVGSTSTPPRSASTRSPAGNAIAARTPPSAGAPSPVLSRSTVD